jgi:hypothetical protein
LIIRNANRQSVHLSFLDVGHPSFPQQKAQMELMIAVLEKQIDEAINAYDEKKARAELEAMRNEQVERAKERCQQRAQFKQQGLSALLVARSAVNPTEQLKAATAAIASFVEYKKIAAPRDEVNSMLCEAQSLAAAAQQELDKPTLAKLFERALELLMTG